MASPRRSLPPGLRPFWAVDNISEATRTFSIETDKYSGHIIGNLQRHFERSFCLIELALEDLFYGTSVSHCLLPCVRTTAAVENIITTVNNDSVTALG